MLCGRDRWSTESGQTSLSFVASGPLAWESVTVGLLFACFCMERGQVRWVEFLFLLSCFLSFIHSYLPSAEAFELLVQ